MSENQNEGHDGATIDEISNFATNVLKQRPNVVLLHAGTNDLDRKENVATAPDRLSALVDKISQACPDAAILVAKLIPSRSPGTETRIVEYNVAVSSIVANRKGAGKKVFLVNQFDALDPSRDLFDTLHPNDGGYSKMAGTWYNAIASVANTNKWIKDPVAGSGLKEECAKNPVWYPQGEIANGAGLGHDLYYFSCNNVLVTFTACFSALICCLLIVLRIDILIMLQNVHYRAQVQCQL